LVATLAPYISRRWTTEEIDNIVIKNLPGNDDDADDDDVESWEDDGRQQRQQGGGGNSADDYSNDGRQRQDYPSGHQGYSSAYATTANQQQQGYSNYHAGGDRHDYVVGNKASAAQSESVDGRYSSAANQGNLDCGYGGNDDGHYDDNNGANNNFSLQTSLSNRGSKQRRGSSGSPSGAELDRMQSLQAQLEALQRQQDEIQRQQQELLLRQQREQEEEEEQEELCRGQMGLPQQQEYHQATPHSTGTPRASNVPTEDQFSAQRQGRPPAMPMGGGHERDVATTDDDDEEGGDDGYNDDEGGENKDESLGILWKMINEDKKGRSSRYRGGEDEDMMDDALSLCSMRDRVEEEEDDAMSLIPHLGGRESLDDL